jgi:tetratricopeptide (TPR) repeat protein
MKPLALVVIAIGIAALVSGCGSKNPIEIKSPALESAERLERRAATAYAKGDHVGATKDFQTAASVYESLAMQDALANTQLSLTRIDSDDGRSADAIKRVNRVLDMPSSGATISPSTLLVAHGRAAALYLQQKDLTAAERELTASEALCTMACEAASALATMRANWLFSSNDFPAAKAKADAALALATTPSDKANALRSLAQIGLAQGEYLPATQHAEQALALDQSLGTSSRVIADLDLLSSIYAKAGDSTKSANFAQLSLAAQTARAKLGGK